MSNRVNIPDPQIAERDALNEAFYKWIDNDSALTKEDYDYWVERWNECYPSEPLVFTQDDIEEGWGDDYESFIHDVTPAMEKDLDTEIRLKREVLAEINDLDE